MRLSHLYNGDSHTGKTASLYSISSQGELNVICKMSAILFRSQCIKGLLQSHLCLTALLYIIMRRGLSPWFLLTIIMLLHGIQWILTQSWIRGHCDNIYIRVSHNQGYHLVCTWGQKWKFIYGPKNNRTWKSIDYSVWNQNIAELSLIFIEL